jgi:hypothetical protein
MVDLQVTTLDGLDAVLDEAKVAEFQAALRGPLIQPGDEGYDEQRQVWNAKPGADRPLRRCCRRYHVR